MTAFKVSDVVSVEFPFSDFQTRKRRPGLVPFLDTSVTNAPTFHALRRSVTGECFYHG